MRPLAVLLFGSAGLGALLLSIRPAPPPEIVDQHGNLVASLFSQPFLKVAPPGVPRLGVLTASQKCRDDRNWKSLLGRIFSLRTVHAQNCQVTGCFGSYWVQESVDCFPGCIFSFNVLYTDPNVSPPTRGRHFNGAERCRIGGCNLCDEVVCDY